ncbi:MAG: TIGR03009 domain-containing protein [Planctomycetales bacterium]|nr:TIGR03009 domain-containing protein [Planctomycetales bacterium]
MNFRQSIRGWSVLVLTVWVATSQAQDIRQPGRPQARPGTTGQPVAPQQGFGQRPMQQGQVRQPTQPGQATQAPGNQIGQPQVQHGFIPALKPAWEPLPPEHQQAVDRVLAYWAQRSSKIKTYECTFARWKYDPVFLPPDAQGKELPLEYSEGDIRYAVPDKAMYKDTKSQVYDAATKKYKVLEEGGHHWVCDGEAIIEMVTATKQRITTKLPADMRGEALRTQGPLPFLFGAKVDEIKQRYWVRLLPPPENVKDRYYIEAYPKLQADAASFQKVWIILDTEMYLPISLVVYNVNYTPQNPGRTSYAFSKRKENPINIGSLIRGPWREDFFAPKLPKGWTAVDQNIGQPVARQDQPGGVNPAPIGQQPGPGQPLGIARQPSGRPGVN